MFVGDAPSASPMRSLERALDVLAAIEEAPGSLRLSEIARATSLHPATTQRLLHTLVARGYVRQDGPQYSMGVASLVNAHTYQLRSPLILAATQVLQQLAVSWGLTATLSTRLDLHQIVLARIAGAVPLRYELPVGEKLPLHLGGGRVLAAGMPDEARELLVASLGEFERADGERVSPERFRAELDEIRRNGFAFGASQRVQGAASLAVPVTDRSGATAAALQLSGVASDFEADRGEALTAALMFGARAVSSRLG
jgi:DNA-binding IclR family transcriptional regulator